MKNITRKSRATREGTNYPVFDIDDSFNLPYQAGFDGIIKEKAAMIDSQKIYNNDKMDELVEQLGYMDYRDALACNKYIIEAKRSGDFHQSARAKVLEYALRTLSNRKREKLEKETAAKVQSEAQAAATPFMSKHEAQKIQSDQARLEILMAQDPKIAQ